MGLWKLLGRPAAREYATVLVGNVVRIPKWADFATNIDHQALNVLTESITGIGKHEMAGSISRPEGGFHWDPHPTFSRLGVPTIRATRTDLGMVLQPGPDTPRDAYTYVIFLREPDNDVDVSSELSFSLKRIRIPKID